MLIHECHNPTQDFLLLRRRTKIMPIVVVVNHTVFGDLEQLFNLAVMNNGVVTAMNKQSRHLVVPKLCVVSVLFPSSHPELMRQTTDALLFLCHNPRLKLLRGNLSKYLVGEIRDDHPQ
eukprot:Lithocolla_globosa_v1_NODE_573_length_3707_cov_10.741512.p2 type:complete len:119 gc:universal NODE_573_length_3707_cov_10.741512:1365-1009(-)